VLAKLYVRSNQKIAELKAIQLREGVRFEMGCFPNCIVQIKLAEFKATQVSEGYNLQGSA